MGGRLRSAIAVALVAVRWRELRPAQDPVAVGREGSGQPGHQRLFRNVREWSRTRPRRPVSAVVPFASVEDGLNVLATVLAKDHGQESQRLLAAMETFLTDIGEKPPASSSSEDATNLLGTAKEGLQALKITPPSC